jgi:hypothetical protein
VFFYFYALGSMAMWNISNVTCLFSTTYEKCDVELGSARDGTPRNYC